MRNTGPTVILPISQKIDLLKLHSHNPKRYPFLLQTVATSVGGTHYDILFACPRRTLTLDSQLLLTDSNADGKVVQPCQHNEFLTEFDRLWRGEQGGFDSSKSIPFQGGWFVFLGYELAQQIEPSLNTPLPHSDGLPVACAVRIPAALIVNKANGECTMVVEDRHRECVDVINQDITTVAGMNDVTGDVDVSNSTTILSIIEEPTQRYIDNVNRIKQYIVDGDVFQVNLSRLWSAILMEGISNAQLYQRLVKVNPAPFFALATFGDHTILSSSPERLIRVQQSRIETRPIAGTRPRGNTIELDQANLQELIAHPKERAEHIMLIDLERNDLGRVCVPGSVNVNELMVLETYAHVHHIVSNVQGQLSTNCTPSDVIRATFPGGTITGCPKVRCMEIIGELEQQPRGAYTGSLGYINHDGSMDLNILIRTLVRKNNQICFRAGAGIVADSDPDKELQETRAKAKGLLLAL